MIIWLFIYSMGTSPLHAGRLHHRHGTGAEGQDGRRLGQLNSIRNLAVIMGSFVCDLGSSTWVSASSTPSPFRRGVGCGRRPDVLHETRTQRLPPHRYSKLHREYRLYYILSDPGGAEKQLFITFAPGVLVSDASSSRPRSSPRCCTIGGIIGIIFQPILGWAIDRFGERVVLASGKR